MIRLVDALISLLILSLSLSVSLHNLESSESAKISSQQLLNSLSSIQSDVSSISLIGVAKGDTQALRSCVNNSGLRVTWNFSLPGYGLSISCEA